MITFVFDALKLMGIGIVALIFAAGLICGLFPRWIIRKFIKSYPDVRDAFIVAGLSGIDDDEKVQRLTKALIALGLAEHQAGDKYVANEYKRRTMN